MNPSSVIRNLDHSVPFVCESTGVCSDTTKVVLNVPGILVHAKVFTDGTADHDATLIIYDNASAASGTELDKYIVEGTDHTGGGMNIFANAENGITVSLSGTGASWILHFMRTLPV
ncbi:MAG TPA: hypothetical protein P5244_12890 [Syntrophales bacterium]|mgnify:FL=1|jgi:hypothetical protein|nr:hypothetical protein [Syntrophales bacterium]